MLFSMANKVYGPEQESFGAIDIEVTRNAYGRQLESSEEIINDYKVSYIRAPKISKVALEIRVFSSREDSPTWVESNLHMVTTFHPEMNLQYGSHGIEDSSKNAVKFCRREFRRLMVSFLIPSWTVTIMPSFCLNSDNRDNSHRVLAHGE